MIPPVTQDGVTAPSACGGSTGDTDRQIIHIPTDTLTEAHALPSMCLLHRSSEAVPCSR